MKYENLLEGARETVITRRQRDLRYYMSLDYSIHLHRVEDEGQEYFIAEVPELPGCKSHGSSVQEAYESVQEAKKDWLLDALARGENIPEPAQREEVSGKVLVRMPRTLHGALKRIAEAEHLSLNQLIVSMLSRRVGQSEILTDINKMIVRSFYDSMRRRAARSTYSLLSDDIPVWHGFVSGAFADWFDQSSFRLLNELDSQALEDNRSTVVGRDSQ